MTLPTSGALSLNDIQTTFGGSNPIGMNEYYAGGSYVPSYCTGSNTIVPASGPISIYNFYGTAALSTSDTQYASASTTSQSMYTFTVPNSWNTITIEVWGAGGSGGGGALATVVNGPASSVSGYGMTTMTANGGNGGIATASSSTIGGTGGTATGGNAANITGGNGTNSVVGSVSGAGANGTSGLTITGGTGGAAVNSIGIGAAPGNNGTAPGAGGGGEAQENAGGHGCGGAYHDGSGGGAGGYCRSVFSGSSSPFPGGTVLTIQVANPPVRSSLEGVGGAGLVRIAVT